MKFLVLFAFCITTILRAEQISPVQVSQYHAWTGIATEIPHPPYTTKEFIVLRKFFIGGTPYFLGVDPNTLRTVSQPDSLFTLIHRNLDLLLTERKNSAYSLWIQSIRVHDQKLTDVGVDEVFSQNGVVLTIDLCPSTKPLKQVLIDSLIHSFPEDSKPIPVSISVSGAWIREHPADLEWLKKKELTGQLKITWINHSNKHRFVPGLPLERDFMLLPGTDVAAEVLDAEVAMLGKGLLPSPFFRFPGLVSNAKIVNAVLELGLIPIGTDAWLAKNQVAHNGSIILIHGNGNEPLGVKKFLKFIHERHHDIQKHSWTLLDLEPTVENSPP